VLSERLSEVACNDVGGSIGAAPLLFTGTLHPDWRLRCLPNDPIHAETIRFAFVQVTGSRCSQSYTNAPHRPASNSASEVPLTGSELLHLATRSFGAKRPSFRLAPGIEEPVGQGSYDPSQNQPARHSTPESSNPDGLPDGAKLFY